MTVERSRRRDAAHLLVLASAWLAVGIMWWRVIGLTSPQVLGLVVASIAACAVLAVLVTTAWISHNVAIFRAKGPRTSSPAPALSYAADWTGRPVVADWPAVRQAAVVVVGAGTTDKTFLAGGSQPADRPAAGPVDDLVAAR